MLTNERARGEKVSAEALLRSTFSSVIEGAVSAQVVTVSRSSIVAGVSGLPFSSPVISVLLEEAALYGLLAALFAKGRSVLFAVKDASVSAYSCLPESQLLTVALSEEEKTAVLRVLADAEIWGGTLNAEGELKTNLSSPTPGPHYYTNLLIGNRIKFDRPLQSTPKSAIDRIGGGSFRSHADTQVLATRWDYLPEENGFPANRQFYLVENGKQIFYSGSAVQPGVIEAFCTHSQNHTIIEYKTECGLIIRRTIFILPQEDGMPLAAEAQMIEVENTTDASRDLRIVCTGMFGTGEVHALREDVIFTTVVSESEVFRREDETIAAISFQPNPSWTKGNIRWSTFVLHNNGEVIYPDQYCAKYSEFIGSGTLYAPERLAFLSNRHSRKGPGFFALSAPFALAARSTATLDQFVCLSSNVMNPNYVESETVKAEIEVLLAKYRDPQALPQALQSVKDFTRSYAKYLSIRHEDKDFEAYVNKNLPFQVFYQTFVSRSLDWTQKGYREIGFREIQDIFASMYYFAGMGETEFVKKLLREWAGNVTKDGYANHNFYWTGKEPGWWSDDALWLLQALDRYVGLTGDYDFLKEEISVANSDGEKRSLLASIRAIITYSSRISVGKHGLPLIDRADWNDCLRVDPDCVSGPAKMELYAEQLATAGKSYGEIPFESEYSESVMNGFLLKVAVDAAIGMFRTTGDAAYADELTSLSSSLRETLAETSWKNDYYARVLFNRSTKKNLEYLGAGGDGLEIEANAKGTYFLNSFSWSVLSGCADEKQIAIMLDSIDQNLKTPFGYRLCTGVDYPQIAPKIDVALYFAGDRENGGIFKHANMMAAAAMLKAAKEVTDISLAERLTETAYWVIDRILPYRTLENPFETCGNPRLCTQYNNSETGENIGPTLSGTSTWLLLCLFMGFGVSFAKDGLTIEPILRTTETGEDVTVNTGKATYHITVEKPAGFCRVGAGTKVTCDGQPVEGVRVPIFEDGKIHEVTVKL